MEKQNLALTCPKCGYAWTYKGKKWIYVSCPNCLRKIRITDA